MSEWEFCQRQTPAAMYAEAEMNDLGADGWELVAVVGMGATHWMYFKREKVGPNHGTMLATRKPRKLKTDE